MTDAEFTGMYDRITSDGWLDREEARFLVRWAERTEGDIVEIGSYQGRSAMLLAQLGRRVWCVDSWDDYFHSNLKGDEIYERFLANIACIAGADVLPVRARVEDWTPVPAGFVYLDGDHTYNGTVSQARAALACRPQTIAAHDVNDGGEGREVKRAVLEVLGPWTEKEGKLAAWLTAR